jgi:FAD/FMN-containing dehydrogenase
VQIGDPPDARRLRLRDGGGMTTTTTPTYTSTLAEALRAHGFVGRVVEPADPDYDRARAGWNGAIDRRPAAVAYASDGDDVAAAIQTARSSGVPFTVRAGSHSVSGRSVRDGALCIDIRGLNRVEVDPKREIAYVGGGTLLGELDAATQEHGLAVPAGQISHTGVGGLTLGGGLGWLMRKHGLTIDSLRAAEVVLADGRLVRASEDEHPDLFWALRGGGGDFGVVTRFEFQAHRVGPMVLAGMFVYPWARAGEALRAAREVMDGAPEELGMFAVLLTAPPEPPFPADLQGQPVAVLSVAWSGDLEEGERVLAPVREACPPALDLVQPMPYVALQSMLDQTAPHGWRFYDRMRYHEEVGDDLLDTLVATFETVPSPQSHIITGWMGGAVDRVAPGATAFGHRGIPAETWIIGCSGDAPIAPVADWVRRVSDDIAPYSTGGTYVNALDAGRSAREAYADEIYDRLVAVKRRYDPDAVFSGNGIG